MALSDQYKPWHSFAGGEISEELFGRVDIDDYQMALKTCQNFVVLPHGPVESRAGTQFIRSTKSDGAARLIPFVRGDGSSLVLEFGNLYIRFHKDDGTVEDPGNPGTPYEVTTTYTTDDLFNLKYEQSVDTITITCFGFRHRELTRTADDDWDLTSIVHESPVDPPASAPTVTATGTSGVELTYRYVVTTVDAQGEESIASAIGGAVNDLSVVGQYNTVVWSTATGAAYYNVYKEWAESGRFFFIASTTDAATGIVDDNIIPDFTKAPPEATDPFGNDNDTTVPSVVSYFEQRRIFAATEGDLQRFWLTKSGNMYNMNVSAVPQDDDPFNYVLASTKSHTIRHIVPFENLLMLTGSAMWRLYPDSDGVLTPTNLVAKVTLKTGATETRPVTFQERLMFANAKGEHLMSVEFSTEAASYKAADLSLTASHLVNGYTWVQMDFQEAPYPTWWGVRSDGVLIGLTYAPDQNVAAWHKHVIGGAFSTGDAIVESIAVVPSNDGTEDVVYLIVKRTINSQTKRYVEFIKPRAFADLEHSFCVDAGLQYDSVPVSTITGLSHLEGEDVSILADGVVLSGTVASGQVDLVDADDNPVTASVVTVGLPYNCDLVTPPLAYQTQARGGEQQEIINGVRLRVKNSLGISAGSSFTKLTDFSVSEGEDPTVLRNGVIDLGPGQFDWDEDSSVYIRQSDPLPVTITALSVGFATAN